MSISVIMSTGTDRFPLLERTLKSWEHLIQLSWDQIDFTLIINSNDVKNALEYQKVFSDRHPFINKIIMQPLETLNRILLREGKTSKGDFVIFSLADELIGDYSLFDVMLNVGPNRRYSTNTYFLKKDHNALLDKTDWLRQPKLIEGFPDFWNHTEWENYPNSMRADGRLLAHITGAYREYWDYIGWFRDDEHGYLNYDRDLAVREEFLENCAMSYQYPCCYHQWHPTSSYGTEERLPGYVYKTELQARLLEKADTEK